MDTLKKYSLAGFLFIAALGTLWHFLYEWTNRNILVGLFCPVNESTWEHIKLLYFPGLFYILFMGSRLKAVYPNILNALLAGLLAGCLSIPVLFYTYSGILGKNLFVFDILVFLVSIGVLFFTAKRLLPREDLKNWDGILFFLTAALFAAFLVFSYLPLDIGLFWEPGSFVPSLSL